MGMVTFTCAYAPCSKVVTYAKVGQGKFRKYCSDFCQKNNRKYTKARLERVRTYFAERQARFRAEGLCLNCGAQVVEGRLHCYEHLRYYRQYQRERRKKA